MTLNSTTQYLGNRICEAAFFLFYGLLRLLPAALFRTVARPFLRLFIRFAIPRRRVVKNLSAAFGQTYATATKAGMAKGVQDHFVTNLLDCMMQISDGTHASRVIDIHGLAHLESALKKGRGVIALGAHIGNFVLLGTRLGLEGHPFHTLFRLPPDRRIRDLITRFLHHYHQDVIPSVPRRSAVTRVLQALVNNEIVYILGDNLKKGRIEALLFGQRVPSPRGPVSLALRWERPWFRCI